jgi:hypothetical protein
MCTAAAFSCLQCELTLVKLMCSRWLQLQVLAAAPPPPSPAAAAAGAGAPLASTPTLLPPVSLFSAVAALLLAGCVAAVFGTSVTVPHCASRSGGLKENVGQKLMPMLHLPDTCIFTCNKHKTAIQ